MSGAMRGKIYGHNNPPPPPPPKPEPDKLVYKTKLDQLPFDLPKNGMIIYEGGTRIIVRTPPGQLSSIEVWQSPGGTGPSSFPIPLPT